MFDYYYGKEAEQFTFIRIPKLLLTDERFQDLSVSAKFVYGVLLDRMGLSRKNGWLDENGRVYIIYRISEIQEDFGFSKGKVIELLKELEKIGLLEKRRRGMGLPSILYVKSFCNITPDDFNPPKKRNRREENLSKCSGDFVFNFSKKDVTPEALPEEPVEDKTSPVVQNQLEPKAKKPDPDELPFPEVADLDYPEEPCKKEYDDEFLSSLSDDLKDLLGEEKQVEKQEVQNLDFKKSGAKTTDTVVQNLNLRSSENEPQKFKNQTSRSSNGEPPICINTISETEFNNTYLNNINLSRARATKFSEITEEQERSAYSQIISENIELDDLLEYNPEQRELISDIYDVIVDTMMTREKTIRVAGRDWSADAVRGRFIKLRIEHVDHVLACMKRVTGPIRDRGRYLRTALFNSLPEVAGLPGVYQNVRDTDYDRTRQDRTA
jgi:hypothetical protein